MLYTVYTLFTSLRRTRKYQNEYFDDTYQITNEEPRYILFKLGVIIRNKCVLYNVRGTYKNF